MTPKTDKDTYIELNMESSAVKAKPIANMLFILTSDKSLLLFLRRSSSRSIFRFCCRSILSPCASFFFSTVMKQTMFSFHLVVNFFNAHYHKFLDIMLCCFGNKKEMESHTYIACIVAPPLPWAFGTFLCDTQGAKWDLRGWKYGCKF